MLYVFSDYSVDTPWYELRRAGSLIHLGPQVSNALAYLITYRDRVVSRDELFERLWPNQFVTDDALGRCVRAARRSLEDPPEAPQYIMTTRGRGYRFIALAKAYYQQVLALAEALGIRPLQAPCHHSLGTLYTMIGQREQARAELAAAISLYCDMEMMFWLPRAEAALVQAQ